MPRHACPQNPDECYIDCPGSGYAHYKPPYGPCEKGCDEGGSMTALLKMIEGAVSPKVFSGTVVGVRAATLSRFANDLADVIPDADPSDVDRLRRLGVLEPDRRFSAKWSNSEPREIVRIIAEATSGRGFGGFAASA